MVLLILSHKLRAPIHRLISYHVLKLQYFLLAGLDHILDFLELEYLLQFVPDRTLLLKVIHVVGRLVAHAAFVDASLDDGAEDGQEQDAAQVKVEGPGGLHADEEVLAADQLVGVPRQKEA